jgi:hypothetical protein
MIPDSLVAERRALDSETLVRIQTREPIFTGIPADRCEEFWFRIEPVLWPAILRSEGRHTSLTVKHAIQDQNMQLWATFSDQSMERCINAVVTSTATFPTGIQECEIVFCAGDVIPDSLPLLQVIEKWAKSAGCTAMALTGRRGWAKILSSRQFSYEESAVVLRKAI